ncbi:MAG: DUF433 domain-containing protein [Nanoarchaeota archaeon]
MKMNANIIRINNYIVADPRICHGKLTFKGTRIMVWQILEMLEASGSVNEILSNYPSLTEEHIKAALHLAAEKLAGERFVPVH